MKIYDRECKSDDGKIFVLTEKGKEECASYHSREVGKPVGSDYSDERYAPIWAINKGYLIEVDDPDWCTLPGYKAVYDHLGYQLHVSNPHVFFNKEMAERAVEKFDNRPWNQGKKAYVIDAVYEGKKPKELRYYEGKPVYNEDWWFGEIGKPGDLVEESIAEWMGNCVPPVAYGPTYIQCGEPSSTKVEGMTYATFKKVDRDVWMYCGNCLKGMDKETGTDIPYVVM